tara:strand:+ start:2345 stop:2647 length:303 start_codon:yes stop_codon:yes gene_type:complete
VDDAHLGEVIGEAVVVVDDDHRPPVVLHQRRADDERQTASLPGILRGTSVDGRDDAATAERFAARAADRGCRGYTGYDREGRHGRRTDEGTRRQKGSRVL